VINADQLRSLQSEPGPAAVRAATTLLDEGLSALAVTARLRRDFASLSASASSAAVTQATLRRRGREKFGADADRLWFTADGLEQATSSGVAEHRAARFAAWGSRLGRPARVADLCCGIGGDLRALAAAGCEVVGVDRDEAAVLAATANVADFGSVQVRCADVETFELAGYDAVFIDPARRASGRRTFDVRSYEPPWSFLTSLFDTVRAGAAKVAPGIAHDLVPPGVDIEWVSLRGGLKEAVLWWGGLRDGVRRRATLLPTGAAMTSTSDADRPAPTGAVRRYVYEPDDAVVRAHLIGDLARIVDGVLPDASTAYVTSDVLVDTPFAHAYEVHDVLPFSLKRLRAALRERDVGSVTIMKRGSAVDVEQLRRDLRLSGRRSAVVVLALVSGRHHAVIAQPAPSVSE
jgi:SAM-dependent methyltransferase